MANHILGVADHRLGMADHRLGMADHGLWLASLCLYKGLLCFPNLTLLVIFLWVSSLIGVIIFILIFYWVIRFRFLLNIWHLDLFIIPFHNLSISFSFLVNLD